MSQSISSATARLPQLTASWSLAEAAETGSADQCLAVDEQLLDQVKRGERGPCIRIWRNRQCLVATVKESRMPNFEKSSQALADDSWPVLVRRTGGSCVPHGPGVINLSLIYPIPEGQRWQLEDSYQLLCLPLQQLLQDYGLKAETGAVEGSFCDGRYNLQVDNRKLVGTAQRWRPASQAPEAETGAKKSAGAILAHACLLTDLDLLTATEQINRLYRDCENTEQFIPEACATLAECAGRESETDSEDFVLEVVDRLTAVIKESFGIRIP